MSRQVNSFAAYLTQPLNIYNFQIRITSINDKVDENVLMVVSATKFPSEKLRKMEKYYHGEKITYAAKPDSSGTWTITVPEGDRAQTCRELDRLKDQQYDQRTGNLTPTPWYDIEVFHRDLQDNIVFSVVLHGCWLLGRDGFDLKTQDVTSSVDWNYEFQYQWIENKLRKNAGSPNPFGEQ